MATRKKASRKLLGASPAVLPKRPEQKHTTFSNVGSTVSTLDSVSMEISTSVRDVNLYSLPTFEGEVYRTLRQYGLILARYQIADKKHFAKKYGHKISTVNTACRIVANYIFQHFYGHDPSEGTVHLSPLASALTNVNASPEALMAALSYVGTDAFIELLVGTTTLDPDIREVLSETADDVTGYLNPYIRGDGSQVMNYHLEKIVKNINVDKTRYRNEALSNYSNVCSYLERVERRHNERQQAKKTVVLPPRKGKKHKGKKIHPKGTKGGWANAILSKPELSISHTGKMGRRIIPANEGKYVRDISRIISDPNQRIFSRKTRSLGGVVVVDCSGSMSLTEEEMKAIMSASAGCTVVAYSAASDDDIEPNIWLIARKGRQLRDLPEFPGGNGVDGPALEYGVSLRSNNAPIVWISDTQVTGRHDVSSSKLRYWCLKYCRKNNIYIVRNCEEATELLSKLQRGQKVLNTNTDRYLANISDEGDDDDE